VRQFLTRETEKCLVLTVLRHRLLALIKRVDGTARGKTSGREKDRRVRVNCFVIMKE
jgi:hypothetical protein